MQVLSMAWNCVNYRLNFEVETMKDYRRITKVQLELMWIESI